MAAITLGIMSLMAFIGYKKGFTGSLISIGSYVLGGIAALSFRETLTDYVLESVNPVIEDFFSKIPQYEEAVAVFSDFNVNTEQINTMIYPATESVIAFLVFCIVSSLCKTLLKATSANKVIASIPIAGSINRILGAVCYLIIPIIFIYVITVSDSFPLQEIQSFISK